MLTAIATLPSIETSRGGVDNLKRSFIGTKCSYWNGLISEERRIEQRGRILKNWKRVIGTFYSLVVKMLNTPNQIRRPGEGRLHRFRRCGTGF